MSDDDLMARFDTEVEEEQEIDDADDVGDTDNAGDAGNRQNVKNYPFYIPKDLREELDALYNRYDGKNKVEGGEGIEKHREFLEPIMRAAIDELDLDDVVPYEAEE